MTPFVSIASTSIRDTESYRDHRSPRHERQTGGDSALALSWTQQPPQLGRRSSMRGERRAVRVSGRSIAARPDCLEQDGHPPRSTGRFMAGGVHVGAPEGPTWRRVSRDRPILDVSSRPHTEGSRPSIRVVREPLGRSGSRDMSQQMYEARRDTVADDRRVDAPRRCPMPHRRSVDCRRNR